MRDWFSFQVSCGGVVCSFYFSAKYDEELRVLWDDISFGGIIPRIKRFIKDVPRSISTARYGSVANHILIFRKPKQRCS